MANDFRQQVGAHRASALQSAMAAMSGSGFADYGRQAVADGAAQRRAAYDKAATWASQATQITGDAADAGVSMASTAGANAIGRRADEVAHQAEVRAARARANQGGGIGSILGPVASIAAAFL